MFKALKKYFRNSKALFTTIMVVVLYIYCKTGNKFVPIEEIAIPSAVGYDVENIDGEIKYTSPLAIYIFPDGSTGTVVFSGKGDTLPETRSDRQLELTGKLLLGLEKVLVISEDASRFGIKALLDVFWSNTTINDNAYVVVSKQSTKDILEFKTEGYQSSGDYIQSIIKHLTNFNFYPDKYMLIDVFVKEGSEGRSIVLPYIEIIDDKLKVTGLALFKDDKMLKKVGINEGKTLNLLRENNVQGIIPIVKGPKEYLSFYGTSKRSVKCKRVEDKYIFDIKLKLMGTVVSNLMYKNLVENPEEKKKIEKALGEEVEKLSYDFINKMQNDYEIDCLELGKCAVEKYGRRKNIDWDEVISQSEINVSAEVKITDIGRGDM